MKLYPIFHTLLLLLIVLILNVIYFSETLAKISMENKKEKKIKINYSFIVDIYLNLNRR